MFRCFILVTSSLLLVGILAANALRADEKEQEIDRLRQKVQGLQKQSQALKLEFEALDKEEKAIVLKLDALRKQIADLTAENRKVLEKMNKNLKDLERVREEYGDAVKQYSTALKSLEKSLADKTGRPVSNPPKKDLKGKVTAVDAESGLVTVSLGADDGLEKGHTLEVYRLKPKPTYVGMLRITEVKKNQASGKMTAGPRGIAQVDDEVSSSIPDK